MAAGNKPGWSGVQSKTPRVTNRRRCRGATGFEPCVPSGRHAGDNERHVMPVDFFLDGLPVTA
jgi:hypothetical protein